MRNSKFQLLLGSSVVVSLGVLGAQGAVYQELGGQVVVEAEQDPKKAPPAKYAKMGHDNLVRLLKEGGLM